MATLARDVRGEVAPIVAGWRVMVLSDRDLQVQVAHWHGGPGALSMSSLTLESAATHWQVGVPLIGTGSFVSRSVLVLTAIEAVSNAVRVSDKEGPY